MAGVIPKALETAPDMKLTSFVRSELRKRHGRMDKTRMRHWEGKKDRDYFNMYTPVHKYWDTFCFYKEIRII